MISHTNCFIFIHIPKTGGTSIEAALGDSGKVLQGVENFGSIYYKHAMAADLVRMLGPTEYERHFTFTFVRDPWDWIVSQYSFGRGFCPPWVFDTSHQIAAKVKPEHRDWPFADWLRWWISEMQPLQSSMVADQSGRLLVDFVGKFERLSEDFRTVCKHIEVPPRQLPHLKASERGPSPDYYDPDSIDLVLEHFRPDFENFGYPLAPPGSVRSLAAESAEETSQ